MRAVKIRAVQENRRLKDTVADLLRRGLEQEQEPTVRRRPASRVLLPLVEFAREASAGEEMTPDRVAEILAADDVDAASTG